jgi:hypothetical protein
MIEEKELKEEFREMLAASPLSDEPEGSFIRTIMYGAFIAGHNTALKQVIEQMKTKDK